MSSSLGLSFLASEESHASSTLADLLAYPGKPTRSASSHQLGKSPTMLTSNNRHAFPCCSSPICSHIGPTSRLGRIRTRPSSTPVKHTRQPSASTPTAAAAAPSSTPATPVTTPATIGSSTAVQGTVITSQLFADVDGPQSPLTPVGTPFSAYKAVDPFALVEDPYSECYENSSVSGSPSSLHATSVSSTSSQHSLNTQLKNPLFASGLHANPLFAGEHSHGSEEGAPAAQQPCESPHSLSTRMWARVMQLKDIMRAPGPNTVTQPTRTKGPLNSPTSPGSLLQNSLEARKADLASLAQGITEVRAQNQETRMRLERLGECD